MGLFPQIEIYCISNIKKWKCLVENETGKKLKCLKFDNGGANGIRRQKNIPRTPQENGVVECMKKTRQSVQGA